MEDRIAQFYTARHSIDFRGRLVLIGCGAVGSCVLELLSRHFLRPGVGTGIVVIDMRANVRKIVESICPEALFIEERITEQNMTHVLDRWISSGDFVIDLAYEIASDELICFCQQRGAMFVNTSVEIWESYEERKQFEDPRHHTLYHLQMRLRRRVRGGKHTTTPPPTNMPKNDASDARSAARRSSSTPPIAPAVGAGSKLGKRRHALSRASDRHIEKQCFSTAIVDHGANPGMVNHFVKRALVDIVSHLKNTRHPLYHVKLESLVRENRFAELAMGIGLCTVHVSERDTQITCRPKRPDEFVNTWSVVGFVEEALAPSELGWGTHESQLPAQALQHVDDGPRNQILLPSRGMNTMARSFVPSGDIVGYVIRHGEAFEISEHLTVHDSNGHPMYRPSVYYVYCPCDAAIASLHELQMRRYEAQPTQRVLSDDIVSGRDELGCLLMGDFGVWWIGSLLDIEETRRYVSPRHNATTLQVAASVISAFRYALQNPCLGLCMPDDLPHEDVISFMLPMLGPFVSESVPSSMFHPDSFPHPTYADQSSKKTPSSTRTSFEWADFVVTPRDGCLSD